jgi:hypothetical protein
MIKGSYLWESVREIAQLSSLRDRLVRLLSVLMFVGMVAAFIAGGSWCLKHAVADSLRNRAAQTWPVADGKVTESRIKTSDGHQSDFRDTYYPQVVVRYEVGGKWYSCRELYFGYGSTGNYQQVSADVASCPIGKQVKVSYNPKEPSQSILKPGSHGINVTFMAVGAVMLGIGLLFGGPLLLCKPNTESFEHRKSHRCLDCRQ